MALTGTQWTISAGDHVATVVEVGAGLRGYTVGGTAVTCGYGEDELPPKGCGITLVPWPNRIAGGRYTFDGAAQQLGLTEPDAGNAIHGLGRWERWTPVRQDAGVLTLGLDVVPQKGYPFQIHAEVTYAVHAEHGLTVTLAARNVGRGRAPFGAGSHPYLATRGHELADVTLTLPATEVLVVDEHQIPVGSRPLSEDDDYRAGRVLGRHRFDDGFTGLQPVDGRGTAEVRTPSGGARLWFDETFGFLQVYTLADLTPGQHGVAVEPMTCAPNAFNSGAGLLVLEPGDEWTGSWGIQPL
ncbi:aldose 1-epimerase [Jatrophihabitans endophyticus]|uniref:Aldose 1-epimerase n=1 Tax=Jatrophihabitans endophyticus TaxID=1206085 RepID=A0A1M5RJR4_9ACTN|nr:aldose 1-epimerase family protein [Jatrophihabitans endophyticus]SHH26440.1 aldose 1-epimerase [Jatrophihabitans endophyticus]